MRHDKWGRQILREGFEGELTGVFLFQTAVEVSYSVHPQLISLAMEAVNLADGRNAARCSFFFSQLYPGEFTVGVEPVANDFVKVPDRDMIRPTPSAKN